MRSLTSIFLSLVLIAGTVSPSAAGEPPYHLYPTNIEAKLAGTLTIYPSGGQPFKCKIVFHLHTTAHAAEIKSAETLHVGACQGLRFLEFPWFVGIFNARSGDFGQLGFTSGAGNCSEGAAGFRDNGAGIWKLTPGGCMSGVLTSDPAVTIVKQKAENHIGF